MGEKRLFDTGQIHVDADSNRPALACAVPNRNAWAIATAVREISILQKCKPDVRRARLTLSYSLRKGDVLQNEIRFEYCKPRHRHTLQF
jgi:hypothetical protein